METQQQPYYDNREEADFEPDAVREYVSAHGFMLVSARERWLDVAIRLVIFMVGFWLIYKGTSVLYPRKKNK